MKRHFMIGLIICLSACSGVAPDKIIQQKQLSFNTSETDPVSQDPILKAVYCVVSDQMLLDEVIKYYKNHLDASNNMISKGYIENENNAILNLIDFLKENDIDLNNANATSENVRRYMSEAKDDSIHDISKPHSPYWLCMNACGAGQASIQCLNECADKKNDQERRASSCSGYDPRNTLK